MTEIRGRQHELRQRNVRLRGARARIRPVEQHRALPREHDVQRMKIEMHNGCPDSQKALEPRWRWNLVQPPMQARQSRGLPSQGPRPPEERIEHRPSVDALHHELCAAGAEVFDSRCGKTVRNDVLHDLRLALHRAAETRAAHDEPGTERKNVRVAAGGEERARALHASQYPARVSYTICAMALGAVLALTIVGHARRLWRPTLG